MKRAFLWLCALCLTWGGAVAWGRMRRPSPPPVSRFTPAPFPPQQRPFVLFFSGRNNGAYVETTLRSGFAQLYDRFRIVYVDEGSTDGSDRLAQELLEGKGTFLRNEVPQGEEANIQRVAALCEPEEILVIPGGDDLLAHEWVLQRLNAYFAPRELWVAYGKALELPHYQPCPETSRLLAAYAPLLQGGPFAPPEGHVHAIDEILTLHNPPYTNDQK